MEDDNTTTDDTSASGGTEQSGAVHDDSVSVMGATAGDPDAPAVPLASTAYTYDSANPPQLEPGTIGKPMSYKWEADEEGYPRLVPDPGNLNKPPLPKAYVEHVDKVAKGMGLGGKDPRDGFEKWSQANGSLDVPVFDVPQVPPGFTEKQVNGYTPAKAALAAESGIPSAVIEKAKAVDLDPRVFFEQTVRPMLADTTTDYAIAVGVEGIEYGKGKGTEYSKALDVFTDERALLAYKAGVPTEAIAAAAPDPTKDGDRGRDPFLVYEEGSYNGAAAWRPPVPAMLAKAGLPEHAADPKYHANRSAGAGAGGTSPELQALYAEDPELQRLWSMANPYIKAGDIGPGAKHLMAKIMARQDVVAAKAGKVK